MSFLNIMLCYQFSLEASCKTCPKITLPKNKSKEKLLSGIKVCTSMKTDKRKNVKFLLQITRIDSHHKLQPLIQTCFPPDYRLLFLRFLLLALSMYFLLEKI